MESGHWNLGGPLELRSVDAAKNRFRLYRITVQANVFGAADLVIEWGRLGSIPRVRIERFASAAKLLARRAELLERRRQHGYVAVQELQRSSPVAAWAEQAGEQQ